jgi:hypothetical protein
VRNAQNKVVIAHGFSLGASAPAGCALATTRSTPSRSPPVPTTLRFAGGSSKTIYRTRSKAEHIRRASRRDRGKFGPRPASKADLLRTAPKHPEGFA